MGRGRRVDYQALCIRDICEQRENLKVVDEGKGLLLSALDVEGEDGRAAVREILLIERVIRVVRQGRVVHLLNLRVLRQELDNLQRVLDMALHTERQRLGALQEQERVERGDCAALIAEQDRADVGHESRRSCDVREGCAVVAWVRIRDVRELAALLPVVAAAVHNDAAERGAVAADELRRGVNHNVSAVLERANQVGRAEGVIDHERQAVLMCNRRNRVDVRDIGVRVTEGFEVDCLGVRANCILDLIEFVRIDKGGLDAELLQRVCKEVIGAAVDGLLCDNVVARLCECLEGVGNCRRTGCDCECRGAALKRCDSLLKDILRGVRKSAVDVAGVSQTEAVRRMLRVAEHIRSGLVNRNGSRIGRRIRALLADMQLKGLKLVLSLLAHFYSSIDPNRSGFLSSN